MENDLKNADKFIDGFEPDYPLIITENDRDFIKRMMVAYASAVQEKEEKELPKPIDMLINEINGIFRGVFKYYELKDKEPLKAQWNDCITELRDNFMPKITREGLIKDFIQYLHKNYSHVKGGYRHRGDFYGNDHPVQIERIVTEYLSLPKELPKESGQIKGMPRCTPHNEKFTHKLGDTAEYKDDC
jgi:hypothetical protein